MKYSIEKIDSIVIFTIKNKQINSSISAQLKEQLLILSQPELDALIVDLTNVETVDTSGYGSFLLAERQLSDYGVPMVLAGACQSIKTTMSILNLDRLFDYFDTVDDAIKAVEESKQ